MLTENELKLNIETLSKAKTAVENGTTVFDGEGSLPIAVPFLEKYLDSKLSDELLGMPAFHEDMNHYAKNALQKWIDTFVGLLRERPNARANHSWFDFCNWVLGIGERLASDVCGTEQRQQLVDLLNRQARETRDIAQSQRYGADVAELYHATKSAVMRSDQLARDHHSVMILTPESARVRKALEAFEQGGVPARSCAALPAMVVAFRVMLKRAEVCIGANPKCGGVFFDRSELAELKDAVDAVAKEAGVA